MACCSRITLAAAAIAGFAAQAGPVQLQVLSATVKDRVIDQAEVLLQKNGMASVHGYTDASGSFRGDSPFSADDPSATLIIRKAGYSTLVAKCPCNGLGYAISSVMQELDGLRIVLNWGDHPLDLDAHLVYAGNHIYWNRKQGDEAMLDVDHTNGFGPETVTILNRHPGQRYIYAVHDYSDRTRTDDWSMEVARPHVRVYVGQTLVRSYDIDPGRLGNLWTVFAIDENGELEDLDRYSDVEHPEDVAARLAPVLQGPLAASARLVSAGDRARAVQFNRDGEVAYRRYDYTTAIGLFQQAVELDPDYGQAYSNLGLAFAKAGDRAEALWADRKAIALAAGADAARVRASSYYNIARIYEDSAEWSKALSSYRAAEGEKHNDAYTAAIARMQGRIK
jgi:tetratricopeptide (TPR) repeat protein